MRAVDTTFLPDKERDETKLKESAVRRQLEIDAEERMLSTSCHNIMCARTCAVLLLHFHVYIYLHSHRNQQKPFSLIAFIYHSVFFRSIDEQIEVPYSFYDGIDHRRTLMVRIFVVFLLDTSRLYS